jgi:hypothetical protein
MILFLMRDINSAPPSKTMWSLLWRDIEETKGFLSLELHSIGEWMFFCWISDHRIDDSLSGFLEVASGFFLLGSKDREDDYIYYYHFTTTSAPMRHAIVRA